MIVDEFTGRTMADRRWGEGLHQAVEAKEGVPIQNETVTLASITYQARPGSRAGMRCLCYSLECLPTVYRSKMHKPQGLAVPRRW